MKINTSQANKIWLSNTCAGPSSMVSKTRAGSRVFYGIWVLFLCSIILSAANMNITHVGEWGSSYYWNVFIHGNYAFMGMGNNHLDIIDISQANGPVKVGQLNLPIDQWETVSLAAVGNYLYVSTRGKGLMVFNISDPRNPVKVSTPVDGKEIRSLIISGNYLYGTTGNSTSLAILDIGDPLNPGEVGEIRSGESFIQGFFVSGHIIFLIGPKQMQTIDISNPSNPVFLGMYEFGNYEGTEYTMPWNGSDEIFVAGNYAYLVLGFDDPNSSWGSIQGLFIVDIKDPSKPVRKGWLDITKAGGLENLYVSGQYLYGTNAKSGLLVYNVTDPAAPKLAATFEHESNVCDLLVIGRYAYMAAEKYGLLVVDLVSPLHPTLAGQFDESGEGNDVEVRGNYAFLARRGSGLDIINISDPATPVRIGNFPAFYASSLVLKGNYAFLSDVANGIKIIDVSNPAVPTLYAEIQSQAAFSWEIQVAGNYLYTTDYSNIVVFDISNPAAPVLVSTYKPGDYIYSFYINGKYLYSTGLSGLTVTDISNPAALVSAGQCNLGKSLDGIVVDGNYAYAVGQNNGLQVFDVSNPHNPHEIGQYNYAEGSSIHASECYVDGQYLYITDWYAGLLVCDISTPSSPRLAGRYQNGQYPNALAKSGGYIYTAEWKSGKLSTFTFEPAGNPGQLLINKSYIRFSGTTATGPHTGPQTVLISNPGDSDIQWTIMHKSSGQEWLNFYPSSGTNNAEITISVDPTKLSYICDCTNEAELVISAPGAVIPSQTLHVDLRMFNTANTQAPFGEFATPLEGSVARGSIPVTGWALDDIEITSLKIYMQTDLGLALVGDGIFIGGARPDVELAYGWYPLNDRAGWGYMMLTNFLPDGPITLYAIATDLEGNEVTLGSRTIIVDNKNAVLPFGAIDTPTQGGKAWGKNYINTGWALTPPPNTIPTNGSTITVWVDGIPMGHPVYNQYREDIAGFFPGYTNSNGAVGNFSLDTTTFNNGVHSIAWSVTDNAGNSDGVGSRYFTIVNNGNNGSQGETETTKSIGSNRDKNIKNLNIPPTTDEFSFEIGRGTVSSNSSLEYVTGFGLDREPKIANQDNQGVIQIQSRELEPIEIHLQLNDQGWNGESILNRDSFEQSRKREKTERKFSGGLLVGNKLKALPVGSYLDPETGIFYWQPGLGFTGMYRLVFIYSEPNGQEVRQDVVIDLTQYNE